MIDQQILECVLNDVFNENNNKHPIYFDILFILFYFEKAKKAQYI